MTVEADRLGLRQVEAVVVAYGAADDLSACLSALSGSLPVTVVDNSSDHDVAEVARRHGARYDDPGQNLGFGAGVNRALRGLLSGTPCDVILVNPDAVIGTEQALLLQRKLHSPGMERVAALSPQLVSTDGTGQRVFWPFPSPAAAWREALRCGTRADETGFAVGTVLLLRWEALHQVGLFDEQFFLYAEETDWQRRALDLGWRSAVCDQVTVPHRGAGTSADPQRREALFHAGTETYLRKWFGTRGWASYRLAVLVGCGIRLAAPGAVGRAASARGRLYLRGPRRVAGLTGRR
jgi:GT2 family glycosyltransferase